MAVTIFPREGTWISDLGQALASSLGAASEFKQRRQMAKAYETMGLPPAFMNVEPSIQRQLIAGLQQQQSQRMQAQQAAAEELPPEALAYLYGQPTGVGAGTMQQMPSVAPIEATLPQQQAIASSILPAEQISPNPIPEEAAREAAPPLAPNVAPEPTRGIANSVLKGMNERQLERFYKLAEQKDKLEQLPLARQKKIADEAFIFSKPEMVLNQRKLRSYERGLERLSMMRTWNKEGKLDTPAWHEFLRSADLNIPDLRSPESQAFLKARAHWIEDVADIFRGRILVAEVEEFMKELPTLSQSPEGRDKAMRIMEYAYKVGLAESKEFNKIIKENNGVPPMDIVVRVNERTEGIRSKMAEKFREGMNKIFTPTVAQYNAAVSDVANSLYFPPKTDVQRKELEHSRKIIDRYQKRAPSSIINILAARAGGHLMSYVFGKAKEAKQGISMNVLEKILQQGMGGAGAVGEAAEMAAAFV